MSFVVRHVSRAADGREIVRPRALDTDTLSVGRNTASDVHLPDLAVTLDHATIRRTGADAVLVEAAHDLPFDADGRSVTRVALDLARAHLLRIGGHRLDIRRGEGGDDVVVTVERVEALSDVSEAKDEGRAFGLAGVMPGKRPLAWALVVAVLALFLAWPVWTALNGPRAPAGASARQIAAARGSGWHGDSSWSSGPLSRAHANLADNCGACHVKPFEPVQDATCVTCHAGIHDHADRRRLASARAPAEGFDRVKLAVKTAVGRDIGRCAECHTEHEGATAMAPTPQRFCSDCHATMRSRLPDTAIGNAGDFGTSHPQFRPAVVTGFRGERPVTARVSLDADPKQENGLKFPHALHLSGTNTVARMARSMAAEQGFGQALACKDCHVADPSGTRFRAVDMEGDCAMCHSLAFDRAADGTVRTLRHGEPAQVVAELRDFYRANGPVRPAVLGGMARRRPGDAAARATAADYYLAVGSSGSRANQAIRAVFSEGGACYDCHTVVPATNPAALNFRVAPVVQPQRYYAKGWFDHAAHRTETCGSCHAATRSNDARDVLLPKIAECRTCHLGEEARHAEVPSSCAMCHDYHVGPDRPASLRDRAPVSGRRPRTALRREEEGPAAPGVTGVTGRLLAGR